METPNNNPQETKTAPEAAAAPAPTPVAAPAVGGMAPVTKGTMPGGWNRFAGYKPGQQNNKKNDRRDGKRGGRRDDHRG